MRALVPNHKIKAYMAQYGISSTELAEFIGMSRCHVSVLLSNPLDSKHKEKFISALKSIAEDERDEFVIARKDKAKKW